MLSNRLKNLKPSPTLALNALATELAKSGRDIISLAVGEPDWDTFEYIKKAAHDALDKGMTKYVPAAGIPELKKAVVDRIKRELGLSYETSQCMIAPGGKQAVFNALQALCNPGDEVIVPAPYWVSYPTMIELCDAKPVTPFCPPETGFRMTAEVLKRALSAKTKVVILTSPSNPTGQVFTASELKDIATVLERSGVWVISDDIYDKMVYDGNSIAPHIAQVNENLRPRVLLANSLSKTYGMTGWRIGSLVGEAKVVAACANFQSQITGCGVSFSQVGAVAALNGPQEEAEKSVRTLNDRRKQALKALQDLPGLDLIEPKGAFYLFPGISKLFGKRTSKEREIKNSSDFASALLDEEGVAVVPGVEFVVRDLA